MRAASARSRTRIVRHLRSDRQIVRDAQHEHRNGEDEWWERHGEVFGVAHQEVSDDTDPDAVHEPTAPLAGDSEPLVQHAVAVKAAGHAVAFTTGEPYSARARRAGLDAFHAEPDDGVGWSGRPVPSASVSSPPEFLGGAG